MTDDDMTNDRPAGGGPVREPRPTDPASPTAPASQVPPAQDAAEGVASPEDPRSAAPETPADAGPEHVGNGTVDDDESTVDSGEIDGGPEDGSAGADPAAGVTSIYVRRRRTPALGFWVTLAIAVPALVALLISPLFDFVDITGVLNFMLTTAVFVGVPLAAIASAIDAFRHRSSGPRGR